MAAMCLLSLGFLLLSVPQPSATQTLTDSSPRLDLPTKQTGMIWPSLPPRGRSDVPIRATVRDRLTSANSVHQWQEGPSPTVRSAPSFKSVASRQNSSSAVTGTQPTSPRARTDTASLALSRALGKALAAAKSSTPSPPTLSPSTTAAVEPVATGRTAEEPVKQGDDGEDDDWQPVGSGSSPTVSLVEDDDSLAPLSTLGGMAQYQPAVLTVTSNVTDVKESQDALLATAQKISTTSLSEKSPNLSQAVMQTTPQISVVSTGETLLLHNVKLTSNPILNVFFILSYFR